MKKDRMHLCGFALLLWSLGWAATAQTPRPVLNAEATELRLGTQLLLEAQRDGFLSIKEISYAPGGRHFVVVACGYECNDNHGFLFRADGSGKRRFTARWAYLLQDVFEWSADGRRLYYYRINSSGARAPRGAPRPGWQEVELSTGRQTPAHSRRLKLDGRYAVFNVHPQADLQVRAAPGLRAKVRGSLAPNATGLRITGAAVLTGGIRWVPVQAAAVTGWVNQNYLREERTLTKPN
jgi:hypothetical protein